MSLPANIRFNTSAPFPSIVKGSGPVTIAKQNGVWTVGFNVANLGAVPAGSDPSTIEVFAYNTVLKTFQQTTLASILAVPITPTNITIANSPYPVLLSDTVIYVDSSGGAITINLPTAAVRAGKPLTIKDTSGNAATAGHNITIVPSGAETIEGLANIKINANYGGFRLYPATGKYVIAP